MIFGINKLARCVVLLIIVLIISVNVNAQSKKKSVSVRDSLRRSILKRDSMMRTFKKSDTSINSLLQKVEYYNTNFNQIKANLSRGIDTAEISVQLPRFEKRVVLIKRLIDNDRSSTLRYLYTIRDLLTRSDDQLDEWQDKLSEMNAKLIQSENELQQMQKDSLLKIVPADSALLATFLDQKLAIQKKWHQLDALNKKLLLKIGLLQNRVAAVYITILDDKDQIDLKIHDFGIRALSCENNYIWAMEPTPGSNFQIAFSKSLVMNTRLFSFMINRDTLIHLFSFLLFVIFFSWVYYNRRKVLSVKDLPHDILSQTTYTARYPLAAAIIVTTAIVPNFYDHPPVVFLEAIFLVMALTVLYLIKRTDKSGIFSFLHPLFWITLIFSISNLFIEVSNVDRVVVVLLSAVAAWIAVRFLKTVKNDPDQYLPYTRIILRAFVALQIISFWCNVFGRFSMAKIIGITAVYNLWLALGLFLMVQLLRESLFLQLEANKSNDGISSYIDFKILQKKLRSLLNVVAVVLWLIMLTQNLNIEDLVFDYVSDMLTQSHKVGNTLFSIGSIIVFIAVLWLSSVLAKIISYLYDFADQHKDAPLFKRKTRTSILIIKIGIFAAGFMIAVAASGFPLDKITIIISAFGIGIGFGLQNIVNNLVSGLILAFEKPVQVGDLIEVDNRSGRITEIGIRSSRIATSDGAEVIIPNGDLIARHVINWTLSNDNRRVELIIGVAYGSDIEQVKGILSGLLSNSTDIMADPEPLVFVHNLSENSVDFRLLFWADDIGTWLQLKSRMLTEIYNSLNEAGIAIPFPQREVYVHLPEGQKVDMVKEEDKGDLKPEN
jgi:potassium efflux system protein